MKQSISLTLLTIFIRVYCKEEEDIVIYGALGHAVNLPCPFAVSKQAVVEWRDLVYNVNHNPLLIFSSVDGKDFTHPNANNYQVNTQDMMLTIANVTLDDAGQYICQSVTGPTHRQTYDLNIVDMPQCSGETNLTVDDELVLRCGLVYAGNIVPGLNWFRDLSEAVDSEDNSDIRYALRIVRLNTTSADDQRTYKCQVTFNELVIEHSCSRTLHVTYGVENVTFSPIKSVYDVNDVIICTARGQPEPHVIIKQLPMTLSSNQLEIPAEWAGKQISVECQANNSVNGETKVSSAQIQLNIATAENKTLSGTSTSRSGNTSTVIVGLVVAALVLILVVVAFVCMCQRKHNKKLKGSVAVPTCETTAT